MINHVIHLSNIFDIAIVSLFVYLFFIFIKQTRSYFILYTLLTVFALTIISRAFDLSLTRKLLDPFFTFFLVIFIVVFQREIRRFFRWLAVSRGRFEKRMAHLDEEIISYIGTAVADMAKKRIGAIIVFSGEYPLDDIIDGGFSLDGKISVPLLMSIFDDSTPGHDGAILIENRRIKKFGVHLPLAEQFKGFATMGTRHRASSGITERTDAMAVVVSEERGTISIAQGGSLRTIPDQKSLEESIRKFMKMEREQSKSWWDIFVLNNFTLKILSVIIACALWFFFIFQANIINKSVTVPFEFQKTPDGLQVSSVSPSSLTVTISGTNQDIQNLKDGDIKAIINLKDKTAGTFPGTITEADITKPAYLDLIKFNPVPITVTIQKTVDNTTLPSILP